MVISQAAEVDAKYRIGWSDYRNPAFVYLICKVD